MAANYQYVDYLSPEKGRTFRSSTGGTIIGGGKSLDLSGLNINTNLVPSFQPIRYERTTNGAIYSSAYPFTYGLNLVREQEQQQALSARLPSIRTTRGAYNTKQTFGAQQASARPLFSSTAPVTQQPSGTTVSYSKTGPLVSPRANRVARAAAANPQPPTTYQIPNYQGHVPSEKFRFGKSYSKLTQEAYAEFPSGRRPAQF